MSSSNNIRNKKARPTMRRGSMLIPVLLIMMLISAIVLSLIQRSIGGFGITSALKQSYSSYQASDSGAEYILNELKKVDNDTRGGLDIQRGEIPQNMSATGFCAVSGVMCFKDINGLQSVGGNERVSDILSIKKDGTYGDSRKIVAASVPTRVVNPTSNLKAEKCGDVGVTGCAHLNQCDIKVSWVNGIISGVSGFEVRRSTRSSLSELYDYGWRIAKGTTSFQADNPTTGIVNSFIVENGDAKIPNQIGTKYYFSVKAKNKNNFALDSLYESSVGPVTLGANDCRDKTGDGLILPGCKKAKPIGTVIAQTSYNCCNGTECYQLDPGWKKSDDGSCAIQKCDASMNGTNCATAVSCVERPTNQCDKVYVIRGYCSSCSAGWSLSGRNYIDSPYNTLPQQYTCCKQTCPANPASTCGPIPNGYWTATCSENNCGNYNLSCTPHCNTGYHLSGNSCVSNTQTCACSAKPAIGTVWNNVSSFIQTWNGTGWNYACNATVYNVNPANFDCHYKCASGYIWNGSSCVPATKTCACSAKPATGTVWNMVSSFTQTWNGTGWDYPCNATIYATTPVYKNCHYKCASGYKWNGSSCVPITYSCTRQRYYRKPGQTTGCGTGVRTSACPSGTTPSNCSSVCFPGCGIGACSCTPS